MYNTYRPMFIKIVMYCSDIAFFLNKIKLLHVGWIWFSFDLQHVFVETMVDTNQLDSTKKPVGLKNALSWPKAFMISVSSDLMSDALDK